MENPKCPTCQTEFTILGSWIMSANILCVYDEEGFRCYKCHKDFVAKKEKPSYVTHTTGYETIIGVYLPPHECPSCKSTNISPSYIPGKEAPANHICNSCNQTFTIENIMEKEDFTKNPPCVECDKHTCCRIPGPNFRQKEEAYDYYLCIECGDDLGIRIGKENDQENS